MTVMFIVIFKIRYKNFEWQCCKDQSELARRHIYFFSSLESVAIVSRSHGGRFCACVILLPVFKFFSLITNLPLELVRGCSIFLFKN